MIDLDTRHASAVGGHTDGVSFVAFAGSGMLITADDDNRVIMRPRTAIGYDVPIVPVEVADD